MSGPDLTTEIIGYRQWRVTPDLELRAAAHRDRATWAAGNNEAVCRRLDMDTMLFTINDEPTTAKPRPCEDTPGQDCECGFYALHDPSDFWYGRGNGGVLAAYSVPESDPLISGVIVGWGKVQVHHEGFRAQYARIVALALPETKRDAVVARVVAAAYGVPCVPVTELPRIAPEFGTTVPAEVRPESAPKRDDLAAHMGQLYAQIVSPTTSWQWTNAPGSYHYYTPSLYAPQPVLPPPAPKRPPSRFERKQSNRQGRGGKRRGPKNIDPPGGL